MPYRFSFLTHASKIKVFGIHILATYVFIISFLRQFWIGTGCEQLIMWHLDSELEERIMTS